MGDLSFQKNKPSKQEIEKLLSKGLSCKEIGFLYKISPTTMSNLCKKEGVKIDRSVAGKKSKSHKRKMIDIDVVKDLYLNQNKAVLFIANKFSVDSSTIKKRLKELSIPLRTAKEQRKFTKKKLSQAGLESFRLKIGGVNNCNWRGGITPLNEKIRRSVNYKNWRTEVFKRDNYLCVFCGKGGEINADHIIPFALILENLKINSEKSAEQCKELWDLSNGRTLCKECHLQTDTWGHKTTKMLKQEKLKNG